MALTVVAVTSDSYRGFSNRSVGTGASSSGAHTVAAFSFSRLAEGRQFQARLADKGRLHQRAPGSATVTSSLFFTGEELPHLLTRLRHFTLEYMSSHKIASQDAKGLG